MIRSALAGEIDCLEPLEPGYWSSVYAFTHMDQPLVARFSAYRDDFERDVFAMRYASGRLPVPTVRFLGDCDVGYVCISDRVEGKFLDRLDRDQFVASLPSLAHLLVACAGADTSASDGYGSWDDRGNGVESSWVGMLAAIGRDIPASRGGGWAARLAESPSGIDRFRSQNTTFRDALVHVPDLRHVVHNDLFNRNVMVDRNAITGVFDWGCAMYGDVLYEIAAWEFWLPWYPQWVGLDIRTPILAALNDAGICISDAEMRIALYAIHVGLAHQIYNANIGDHPQLERTVQRTDEWVSTLESLS